MPPLKAPPGDDGWDAAGGPDDGRRRGRGRWAWLAAALVLVLLLGGGAWFLLNDGNRGPSDETAGTTTPVSSSAGPTGILLDPNAFVGRPADDVEAELETAGLVVSRREADDDLLESLDMTLEPGDVARLEPSGSFAEPETPVTLFVADEGYTPEEEAEETTEPTETTESEVPTSSAPTTTSAPTSTSESAVSTEPTEATQTTLEGTTEPPETSGAPAGDTVAAGRTEFSDSPPQ
jgi:serine/threonine-protein kinase